MNRIYVLLLFLCPVLSTTSIAQKIATLEVELTKPAQGLYIPVSIELDDVTLLSENELNLSEVRDNEKIRIPIQIRDGENRTLYWLVKNENNTRDKLVYELAKGEGLENQNLIQAKTENGILTIHSGDKNLLGYYYEIQRGAFASLKPSQRARYQGSPSLS